MLNKLPCHLLYQLGISIIYQELNVLNNMDIAENIFVGREKKKNGFVDKKLQHEEARALLDRVIENIGAGCDGCGSSRPIGVRGTPRWKKPWPG